MVAIGIPFPGSSVPVSLGTLFQVVSVFDRRQKLRTFGAMFLWAVTFVLSTLAGFRFVWTTLIIFHTISLGVLQEKACMFSEFFHSLLSVVYLGFNKFHVLV